VKGFEEESHDLYLKNGKGISHISLWQGTTDSCYEEGEKKRLRLLDGGRGPAFVARRGERECLLSGNKRDGGKTFCQAGKKKKAATQAAGKERKKKRESLPCILLLQKWIQPSSGLAEDIKKTLAFSS